MFCYVLNLIYYTHIYTSLKSGIFKFTHHTKLELIWTIIPSLILVLIGLPSFVLLYAMDEIIEPDFVIKCIGHQWYWSYEVEYTQLFSPIIDNNDINTLYSNCCFSKMVDKNEDDFIKLQNEIHNYVNKNIMNLSFNDVLKIEDYITKKCYSFSNSNEIEINSSLELEPNLKMIIEKFLNVIKEKNDMSYVHPIKYNFFNNYDYKWDYLTFDSYMINNIQTFVDESADEFREFDTSTKVLRLLETDNALYIPIKTHIDLLISSSDVLHCWTIPSFGLKVDAVPGRINHANVFVERAGVFYGQCSEICGVNHGFMPIKVIGVIPKLFFSLKNDITN